MNTIIHAERPWNYPMEPDTIKHKGRPNDEESPENLSRCLNCPMTRLGYMDCPFTTLRACKRAERLKIHAFGRKELNVNV